MLGWHVMLRALAIAGCLVLLGGCASPGPPQADQMLAHGTWDDEGLLHVEVGLFDHDWRSADCDCTIEVEVGGQTVGTWKVQPSDFGPGDEGHGHVWRATVEGSAVPACGQYEPFQSLSARAQLADRSVEGGWLLACKPI